MLFPTFFIKKREEHAEQQSRNQFGKPTSIIG
jgi:hypothetical protein